MRKTVIVLAFVSVASFAAVITQGLSEVPPASTEQVRSQAATSAVANRSHLMKFEVENPPVPPIIIIPAPALTAPPTPAFKYIPFILPQDATPKYLLNRQV